MPNLVIAGLVLLALALIFCIMLTVKSFKISSQMGILSILAPLFLASGLSIGCFLAYNSAKASCGEAEAQKKGEAEAKEEMEDLKNTKDEDMQLF